MGPVQSSADNRKVGRSRASRPSVYFGPLHDDLWVVVERAWAEPFAISSNFARQYAIATATAASQHREQDDAQANCRPQRTGRSALRT